MFDKFKKALFGNPTEQRCEHARFVLIAEQIAATDGNEFYVEGRLFGKAKSPVIPCYYRYSRKGL
ncbi:hypothetical protein [Atopobium fossor]|uniref:hypothetical protein n=1 Tax=Atopobium fossor TaxID=39487 RepID=UPI000487E377|nr:hypothetical protein [Atopobium fossor]